MREICIDLAVNNDATGYLRDINLNAVPKSSCFLLEMNFGTRKNIKILNEMNKIPLKI